MGMLLTDAQRKWVDILKESAKKKQFDHSIRPEVGYIPIDLFTDMAAILN